MIAARFVSILRALLKLLLRHLPKERATPRPLPLHGGFSQPHREFFDYALELRRQLALAEKRLEAELAAVATPTPTPTSIWDVKLYSSAVTVFCAMSVEAAINAYGLMRFGKDQLEAHFRLLGPTRRLEELVRCTRGVKLRRSDPLLQATRRLFARRNAIVHPQAAEASFDARGFLTVPESAWGTPTKTKDADASINDMRTFFSAFPMLDRDAATFLRPFPLPRS